MTVIAGLVEKGGVWLAADSATCTDWTTELARDAKLFPLDAHGETLGCAIAGSWKFAHLLRYKLELPEIPRGVELAEWMNTVFAEELTQVIDDALGEQVQEERWKDVKDGCALIAVRGRMFLVDASDSGSHEFASSYASAGAGAHFAMGAFAATSAEAPHTRIHRAMKAALKHGRDVKPPIRVRFFSKRSGGR